LFRSRHGKLVAIFAGIILAGVPVAAINFWAIQYVEQRGENEVSLAAKRAMLLAERRIGLVIAGLTDLSGRGISSCSFEQIEAMHQTAFSITPIKEVAVVGPEGQAYCTSLGLPFARDETISRPVATSAPDFVIEVVRIVGRSDPLVRVRRIAADGKESLAALIPADLLMPKLSPDGGAFRTYSRLATRDGTLIEEGGLRMDEEESPRDRITVTDRSADFGLVVTASMSRSSLYESYAGVRLIGPLAGLAMLLLAVGVRTFLRHRKNPIVQIERANEFVPYFQPILDVTDGRLVGAEVLARWRRSDGTMVQPMTFIPLAESSGVIFDLTRALMQRVCREAGQAIGRRPHFMISFNMTAGHFLTETTVDDVRKLIEASPIAPTQVVLEVTERQPLEDLATARRVIASLQELGFRVALDDVGTGHGGLSYLLKLGVDILKIDKLFVDAIGAERYSTTIIKSMCELARSMGMEIVAEGVENFEQVSYLRSQGIRYAQGYVFAPPLPCASFLKLLEAADPVTSDGLPVGVSPALPHYLTLRNRVAAA
jgi:sensor c-di-GMP phosphodiesterase-like protein